jgi:GNAT superfamily N-acetyltransferase
MDQQLRYWWETTPKELLAKHVFIKASPATETLRQEVEPFDTPKKPLEGFDGLDYQLALSDRALNNEARLQRQAHHELPVSGDSRSGILAFDGDQIVASFVLVGTTPGSPRFKLVVNPEHRGTGLAQRLFEIWGLRVKRLMTANPKQPITYHATVALLAAHKAVVEQALAEDLPVPDNVKQAVASGEEQLALIQRAWEVQNATPRDVRPTVA